MEIATRAYVDAEAARLVAEVRAGAGPRFLHAVTYRLKGHVSVDPGAYRDPTEVARALETDPLRVAREKLGELCIAPGLIEAVDAAAQAEIAASLAQAEAAPWPDRAAAYTDVQDAGAGQWR